MTLLRRSICPVIEAALADTPVVVVNGARQVGKTTLVSNLRYRGSVEVATLDDPANRQAAETDPRAFVQRPVDTLVIDEAQLVGSLFRAVKAEVDRDRRPGRFVLTGSSRLLAAPGMADALVGRVETVELWPFSQGELHRSTDTFVDQIFDDPRSLLHSADLTRADLITRVVAGGFPDAVGRTAARRRAWFNSYVQTVVQSTIAEVSHVQRLAELPRLLRLCAARSGTELNVASLAAELGLPARTTDGYLALLSTAFLVQLIPAWSTNLSKKVVRRSKVVVSDSGLAANLIGASVDTLARSGDALGPLLETFVITELQKQVGWSEATPSLWHFRDRSGAEVDVVLEHPDGRIVGLEVKATSTPTSADLRGLRFLEERLGDRFQFGVLLTTAPEATPFGDRLAALPVGALWATRS